MTLRLQRLALAACAAVVTAASLTACFPLVAGGAALGTMVAMDRRTSGAQLEDEGIELRSASRLREAFGDRARVNVTSYNRQVLLTGEVASDAIKQQVEQVVAKVENVRSVVNDLAVIGTASLTSRSSDALVTGKVKASLVDDRELMAGAFKVVTERGTTYLMGLVTQREADRATNLARSVSGVQRVVRMFEIISDEDLRRIGGQQAGPAPAPAR